MTRPRAVLGLAVLGLVAVGLLTSPLSPFSKPDGTEVPQVEGAIRALAFGVSAGDTVSLDTVPVPMQWDSVVVLPDYPEPGDFERVAGFSWNVIGAGSWASEGNVVAFLLGDRVVAWVNVQTDVYFLGEGDPAFRVSREESRFQVVPEPSPDTVRRLVLVE